MFHKDTEIINKNNETNKFNTQTSLVFSHRRDRGPLFLTKEMLTEFDAILSISNNSKT